MSDFKEFNKWVKRIHTGCSEMREPPYEGIPTPLPKCNLTDDACRFDVCPKRKTESVFGKNDVKTSYDLAMATADPEDKTEWVLRSVAEQKIQKFKTFRDNAYKKWCATQTKLESKEKEIQKLRSELADLKFKFKRNEENREQAVNVANEMILKNTKLEGRIADLVKFVQSISPEKLTPEITLIALKIDELFGEGQVREALTPK